jgi:hypothetical protein
MQRAAAARMKRRSIHEKAVSDDTIWIFQLSFQREQQRGIFGLPPDYL